MQSMDVFSLRNVVVQEYEQFATSFTRIYAADIREQVRAIYAQRYFWPEPLIQINANYQRATDVPALVAQRLLDPGCADIFPITLYRHQEEAISIADAGESYVVTTGTGSGKSLCFFIPIVNAILAEKRADPARRTRAIVIYPMNALANSQLEELGKYIPDRPEGRPVTFARYTGQESQEERRAIADDPPDILLTNFMMLELLLTRQDPLDKRVIRNCGGLRFLVLDELHTYRGRQGADVAMLVRRVREQLSPDLQCIGTSATMKTDGTASERRAAVAAVASRLFAARVPGSNVIEETLERATDPAATRSSVRPLLGAAIDAGVPADLEDAALRTHPLAIWVETVMGMYHAAEEKKWRRAPPLTLTEAREQLSADAGRPPEVCGEVLKRFLLISSQPERERVPGAAGDRSFFAFKLHQFISGAGHAYATLEQPGVRRITVEGQQFLPGVDKKRLYATHFCRECGQEYHPVWLASRSDRQVALSRDIDDVALNAEEGQGVRDEEAGFLMTAPTDPDFTFENEVDDYPENWREADPKGESRLKREYREVRARALRVQPDGTIRDGAGSVAAWFLPGRFRFCLRCGEVHSGNSRDRNRLSSLSAEGRSSATTVLVSSILRWMHGGDSGLPLHTRKLLGFSDNRQDAALQAGHFNDFLFVSMIRAGFLGALSAAGEDGLLAEDLGKAQQKSLGFDKRTPEIRAEWLHEPGLLGANLMTAERTLREVLAYRAWFDQRRGWRYTSPNLEQLGLMTVRYLGLEEMVADTARFASTPPILRDATPEVRAAVYRVLLDHLRTSMAIQSEVLEPVKLEQIVGRSRSWLRAPWGFGPEEKPPAGRWLMIRTPAKKDIRAQDEELFVRAGSRSGIGRRLKSAALWQNPAIRDLKSAEMDRLIEALLTVAAKDYGLVRAETTPFNVKGWQLVGSAVVFCRGGAGADVQEGIKRRENTFFRAFYESLATMLAHKDHPLFGFEAREHTAQVEQEKRQVREKRFRYGGKEQQELAGRAQELRDMGEGGRFLPVLFCSPTMELGVDISQLNAVYLRNVPPTPANYAQRSGRAGRSGQAALVLTYASAQGPHDQYFFREPKAMVHGEVRAPMLDLANRDLVESHLQAIWLSCTDQPLDPSISELLVLNDAARPLRPELVTALAEAAVTRQAVRRMERLLGMVAADLTPEAAPWYPGAGAYAAQIAAGAAQNFDRAFNRWRELFQAAEQQRDAARKTMDDHSAPGTEKRAARSRHEQALDQIALLMQGDSNHAGGDFYTYRYLATEGFLPGYNFPRLPLMAYIPKGFGAGGAQGRQTWLQRPRFLGLAEFGPRSLVYHEGRAFRVVRAMIATSQKAGMSEVRLPTEIVRICRECGAGHFEERSVCHACGRPLGTSEIVRSVYRIENVSTWPVERITSNDEERQRQGFELQTTFQWAVRDGAVDVRRGDVVDGEGMPVLRLVYGPGARIIRLNKGLRRRANKAELGFWIDPISGYWSRNTDEDDAPTDPTSAPPQLIVPSVRDHKNALLVQPVLTEGGTLPEGTMATLQYALLRGLEAVYQLEEGELLVEPMPSREIRNGFLLYEATEGGAGVLTRLIAEPGALASVAQKALHVMHWSVEGGLPATPFELEEQPGTRCVAGCYRCLLSYYNQPDHEQIDRCDPLVLTLLHRIAGAATEALKGRNSGAAGAGAADTGAADAGAGDDPVRAWEAAAAARGLPAPDAERLEVGGVSLLCWRESYVAASFGGLPEPERERLEEIGFELVDFPTAADQGATRETAFARLAALLGRS